MRIVDIFSAIKYQLRNPKDRYEEYIREEAKLGGQLFGYVPLNVDRSFFCLDRHTWVWHEEKTDRSGNISNTLVRYEVQPDRVLKVINGHHYLLDKQETVNLYKAALSYYNKIRKELYFN
ncbi:MAG TPA: hypothetical protein VMR76_02970 [Candidatus Saccharimonadia bacterium]|nr:hypothetical protein [Candidatus Saccharimonadia bacterium]